MIIKKVGVVGCGQMGSSIALLTAQSGYETIITEVNEELLNKGIKTVYNVLERNISRGRLLKRDEETVHNNLRGTINIEDLRDCDLIIETIVENIHEKIKVFTQLDSVCLGRTILASNTSSLSITDMATATKRPEKVIGLHFFYPVIAMTLLEVVTTILTSDETIRDCKAFGESMGKSIIIAKDEPGFIVNRLVAPFLLDAIRLFESGVASREDIDSSMVLGLNHPMGPLRLCDFIGLDTVLLVTEAIYEQLLDEKFTPPKMLKSMVAAGHLGRKSGKGFYEYK